MTYVFPADKTCHARPHPLTGLCLNPPIFTLVVEGGGWVAKLCAEHFTECVNEWGSIARRQEKRLTEIAS